MRELMNTHLLLEKERKILISGFMPKMRVKQRVDKIRSFEYFKKIL